MDLETIIAMALDNKEIIGLFAVIATAIGALYRPILDLVKILPKAVWSLTVFVFQLAWFVIWPLRKLVAWSYAKFLAEHVGRAFDRMFDWIEKREAVKKAAQQSMEQ